MQIIFPDCKYRDVLARASTPTLYDRRSKLCTQLFNNISNNVNHKLAAPLPPKAVQHTDLRSNRKFSKPLCRTALFEAIVNRGIFVRFFFSAFLIYCTYYCILNLGYLNTESET